MTRLAALHVDVRLGRRHVVRGVSFGIEPGALVGLVGPNGAGKTTLMRALAGLVPLAAGSVTLDGRALHEIDRRQVARTLAYLPQGAQVHWPLTVERLVALGRIPHHHPWRGLAPSDAAAVARALEVADAAQFAGRPVHALSQGERARVLLARALASEPAVLLADEPTAALDPYHQLSVMELFAERCAAGLAALVILHDLTLAARFCERLVLLDRGAVVAAGAPQDVLTAANLKAVYGIEGVLAGAGEDRHVLSRHRVDARPSREEAAP